jgi:hypothetical protein
MKHRNQCNGRFGLIRYKLGKSFYSKRCRDKYGDDTECKAFRIKKRTDFLTEKP